MSIIDARVIQKTDTEDKWLQNELTLYKGELALVQSDNHIVNIKVGTGRHKFRDLPYLINYTSGLYTKAITPSSYPSGDAYQSYIVTEEGTYTNFGGVVLPKDNIGVIYKNLNQYTISLLPIVSEDALKEFINERLVDANLGFGGQLTDLSQSATVQGMYIPRVEGVYPNFGGLEYDSSEGLVIFLYKDDEYTKISIPLDAVDEEVRFNNEVLGVSGKAVEKFAVKKINNIAELRNTQGEYEGQIIELLGYYNAGEYSLKYKWTNTQAVEDGGAVINSGSGSWTAQFENELNIKMYGVTNDTDSLFNTLSINKALKEYNKVIIPIDLEIKIKETFEFSESEDYSARATSNLIILNDNNTLIIEGELKYDEINNTGKYDILFCRNVSNVTIDMRGVGKIQGNYLITDSSLGLEHGHGVSVLDCEGVNVINSNIYNVVGDCIYFGGDMLTVTDKINRNINIYNNKLHSSGRQGISVTKAEDFVIENNYIYNIGVINGTVLGCGIDIEPEWKKYVSNGNIINNKFYNNYSTDINLLILKNDPDIYVSNLNIENNNIIRDYNSNTSSAISIRQTANISPYITNITIVNNIIKVIKGDGIASSNNITGLKISNNSIYNTNEDSNYYDRGISVINVINTEISNNSIQGRFNYPIYIDSSNSNIGLVKGNIINKSGLASIYIRNANNYIVESNYIHNANKIGLDFLGVKNLNISNNNISNTINQGINSVGYNTNVTISNNTLNECCSSYSTNTEGSVISIIASASASANNNVIISGNCIYNTNEIYRHIYVPNSFTNNAIVKNNNSNGKIKITNGSTNAITLFDYRKIGLSSERPILDTTDRFNFFDTTLNKPLYWDGNKWTEYLITKSTAVANTTTADATDLATALNLVNELKAKLNAKLTADRNSGQQAT